jgi:Asp-tRNA(Asn)/Glu-tRNA(Gln) amidotransferase A subunit family amidase
MSEPFHMGAVESAQAIAAGRLTAESQIESFLERNDEREPEVGAWIHLDPDAARTEARARDGAARAGPLHGVPAGMKDIIDTADMPTGYGSPIYDGYRPGADAACIALLRASGMVLLGKTVSTEFAVRHPGKTRNPHNPAHTPGGSSSGSAAAVADFMVPVSAGTQTAGSVIRPAAYCGIVGYKPTHGTIPRAGVKLLSESLDTVGTYGRSVADAAAFCAVLSGRPVTEPVRLDRAPRIGFCRSPAWDEAEDSTKTILGEAAEQLAKAGATVSEVDLPSHFERSGDAQQAIMGYEAWRSLAYERENHADQISEALTGVLDAGGKVTNETYVAALEVAAGCRAALTQVFEDVDLLLTPSAPGEAPEGLESTGSPAFNRIWTMLGVPCVNIPGYSGPQGLPVGVQIVGPRGADARTLAGAAWAHNALG